MTFPSSDPYASPSGFVPKPGMEPAKLRYMESFQYIFTHPEWVMIVLLASVCNLIPVIGPLVMLGYQYEVVESLHRFPGQLYPKFDFGRFSQYLTRGVWPFLVGLIVGFVIFMPLFCGFYAAMLGIGAAASNSGDAGGIAVILGMGCMMLAMMAVGVALSIILTPLYLRAGLSQDFNQAFKFDWVMNFASKMWLETLLASLFLAAVVMFVMLPLTLITCYIAAFFINAFIGLAWAHLSWQLYSIYLARGGEPIPLKPWDGPAPMVPAGMPPGAHF